MAKTLACLLLLVTAVANADYLDITTSLTDGGTFGVATFKGQFTDPVGTGIFEPFWRARQSGNDTTYEFFNTDARPLSGDLAAGNNANGGDITNRTFLVSTLLAVDGQFVFLLDTNEPNGGGKDLLSLDRFIIRTSSSSTINTYAGLAGANLVYDIDTAGPCQATMGSAFCTNKPSNGVKLTEELNPGSGKTNMAVLVPVSLFAGHENEYLYLDAQFGNLGRDAAAQAGFEEWSALRGAQPVVPEPSSIVLLGTVLAGVCYRMRKRRAV